MSYLCQKYKKTNKQTNKQKKMGLTDFVSEIKRMENYPDFEKIGARNSAWSTGFYS